MKSEVLVKPQPRKHFWKPEEDLILKTYIETHGEGNWATVSKESGLKRGGKSCRLRWKNYLRPDIKRGGMSQEEEDLIIRLHKLLGNRWSLIAGRLPGRTDNEVKNYWNTHLNKKCSPRGKRKAINSDSKDGQESKKKIHSCDTQITCFPSSTSIAETRLDVRKEGREENSSNITNSWMEETHSFDCDLDPPIAPGNRAVLGFDDEPLMNNLDFFILLEALDFNPNLQWVMP